MSRRTVAVATALLAAVALAAGIGGYAVDMHRMSSREPVWTEGSWPFPIDQWGQGWTYQCKAADCGTDVTVYLRPKIGFCNCKTGVADDEELDRVSDTDLLSSEKSPLGSGRAITVHWMKGRSRGYAVGTPSVKRVLSLAFNDRCDVIVATAVAGDEPAAHERAVLEFLNGERVRNWAEVVLGR